MLLLYTGGMAMATKPFWMLEGRIDQIRHIEGDRWIEDTYEDENGDRAIIHRPHPGTKPLQVPTKLTNQPGKHTS
mgnify:CR=1 FL=1